MIAFDPVVRILRRVVIEATLQSGKRVLDIHHLDHPGKGYGDDDLICAGFSAPYDAMRREFGGHMVDGIAGENIVVEFPAEVWPDDLGESLTIENKGTGETAVLNSISFAEPCAEFGRPACYARTARRPARDSGRS